LALHRVVGRVTVVDIKLLERWPRLLDVDVFVHDWPRCLKNHLYGKRQDAEILR
jgi:hypothetical protein